MSEISEIDAKDGGEETTGGGATGAGTTGVQAEEAAARGVGERTGGGGGAERAEEELERCEPPHWHGRERWGKVAGSFREEQFLQGPRARLEELKRIGHIAWEFLQGFRHLHFAGPCVTVFGSARFEEDHRWYKLAREVGAGLARAGFTVCTGGGPGIMEAANRGAKDVGGRSVGMNIILPHEQAENAYLDEFLEFDYFFVRKVMLLKYSYAFITMPGGFGTLDEIYETATLIQTGKIKQFPLVLMGRDYWADLLDFMENTMVPEGTIAPEDFRRILVTDDPEEAVSCILTTVREEFGLEWKRKVEGPKAKTVLGERGV